MKKFASSWERDGQEAEIKEKGRKIAHPTLNMSRRESSCKFLDLSYGRRDFIKGTMIPDVVKIAEKLRTKVKSHEKRKVALTVTSHGILLLSQKHVLYFCKK